MSLQAEQMSYAISLCEYATYIVRSYVERMKLCPRADYHEIYEMLDFVVEGEWNSMANFPEATPIQVQRQVLEYPSRPDYDVELHFNAIQTGRIWYVAEYDLKLREIPEHEKTGFFNYKGECPYFMRDFGWATPKTPILPEDFPDP